LVNWHCLIFPILLAIGVSICRKIFTSEHLTEAVYLGLSFFLLFAEIIWYYTELQTEYWLPIVQFVLTFNLLYCYWIKIERKLWLPPIVIILYLLGTLTASWLFYPIEPRLTGLMLPPMFFIIYDLETHYWSKRFHSFRSPLALFLGFFLCIAFSLHIYTLSWTWFLIIFTINCGLVGLHGAGSLYLWELKAQDNGVSETIYDDI